GVAGNLSAIRLAADASAVETHLRKGVGRALLEHLIALARSRGYRTLCLETGSAPSFTPAITLYTSYGFAPGPAFGEYKASDFNQFFYLDLADA
ncbi:MAG: GNAT family N-acetyltransferase, partial [Parvularculaceae bacterium]|nr:GNAT family N-acetyltransferase [Parvularculaceae bacterium]